MGILMSIRSLPARLAGLGGAGSTSASGRSVLQNFIKAGFLLLAEESDREIVLGRIGQFWRLTGGESPRVPDPHAFIAFDRPGFAKVAANFHVEVQREGSTSVSTETRIAATDASARAKFAAYWTLIYPGSALIRREWLRAIGLRALRTHGRN